MAKRKCKWCGSSKHTSGNCSIKQKHQKLLDGVPVEHCGFDAVIEIGCDNTELNFVGKGRVELSDTEIKKAVNLVAKKIETRLTQKHRGSYIGNHETYGIVAEEFDELLDALRANDNQEFFAELLDIAVGCVIGMASMYANFQALKETEQ